MTWLLVAVAIVVARGAADQVARGLRLRVGRAGRLLCFWRLVGEGCLRCRTDYRYVRAHPTPYTGRDKTDARVVIPLCARCWPELSIGGRLDYYGLMLTRWRQAGLAGDEWDETRTSVYAAVMAGL